MRCLLIAAIGLVSAGAVPAQGAGEFGKEQLIALLNEQTAIATRTRMNADFVPGMVSVLRGDDLEARGVRTVWEALALVPGIELAIERTGRRKVLVRGLGNTWASGNVKILLNDVSMNSAEQGLADPVLNIPVEQVERIEVIRGPGSAIYGGYAYMGVINVITRSKNNKAYAFGGSFDTQGIGAVLAFTEPDNPVQASLSVSGWRSSGSDVTAGPDFLYQGGYANLSYAPGPANEAIDAGTAVFELGYQGFSLRAQWTQDGLGDHFGINYYLPPHTDDIVERSRHRTVDMRQEIPLSPALTAGVQLGWKDVERRRDDLYVYPSDQPGQPDTYLDSRYLETEGRLEGDLTYRGRNRHTVLLAASTRRVRVDDNWIQFHPAITEPVILIPEGTTRTVNAVTLQDEFRQSDLFTLTTGLRYDHYSDVGTEYSPRIAGVWRLNERHIIKAQYARAFRPPSLYELQTADFFDQPSPQPATIETAELGYIFKGDLAETKLTSFYSRLNDLVVFNYSYRLSPLFGNDGAASWGLELEQSWRATQQWRVDGNLSYVDTRDKDTGEPFPGSVRWIANAGLSYQTGSFIGALHAHHVSGYFRQSRDPRSALDGYTTVDLTSTFGRFLAPGLRLRLGVKNLFDADVRYPAPIYGPNPILLTYEGDFPRPGRIWWAQLTYDY